MFIKHENKPLTSIKSYGILYLSVDDGAFGSTLYNLY